MNTPFSPKELLAAKESRAWDVIEDVLMGHEHNVEYTENLVIDIAKYMTNPSTENEIELARSAKAANLLVSGKVVREVRDSQAFQDIVAQMVEDIPQATIVAKAETEKSPKGQKSAKGSKGAKASKADIEKVVVPMPAIADIAALEELALNRKALVAAMKAINVNVTTWVRANASTKQIVEAIARHVLKVDYVYQAPSKAKAGKRQAKAKQQLPVPIIPTIADLEAMDRKALVQAAKAINTHKDTGVKANGKSADIQQMLALEVVGVTDYVPTATTKTKATGKLVDLTDLSWDECKDMKYGGLRDICRTLRHNGLYDGKLGGSGITKVHFRKVVADYLRSQGHEIVEVTVTQAPKAINTPLLDEYKQQYKLSQQATALIAQADAAEAVAA